MLLRMAAAVDRLRGSVDLQEKRQCSVVASAKDGCCSGSPAWVGRPAGKKAV